MKKSVQQIMDETMCRPGYQWNDTLKRCLAMGGGKANTPPEVDPVDTANPAAPAKPVDTGRGSVRVNANGVKQTGTSMTKGVPVK